ncbi:hypothetical protein [Cytobacillus sp.]|uniref:hypothetical protein n=1 Tax=Cytobacillus sp. TaxID=2675269 RepID=UPI0035184A76
MPLQACIKCYRVWEARKVWLDGIDMENLKNYNQTFVICSDCNTGKEESVLKNSDGTFKIN